jgi:hypothetical protein
MPGRTSHLKLTARDFSELNGIYRQETDSTTLTQGTVFQHFSKDTVQQIGFTVKVTCPDNRNLKVDYMAGDTIFKTINYRGRYKAGYFRSRTKTSFIFPGLIFLWGIRTEAKWIGLTFKKDLLVVNESGGTAFVLIVPVFGNSGDYSVVFDRK